MAAGGSIGGGARAWAVLEAAAAHAAARGALLFHLDLAAEVARAALTPAELGGGELVAVADEGGYGVACVEWGLPARLRCFVRFDGDAALVTPDGLPAGPALEAMAAAKRTVVRAELVGPRLPQAVLVVPPDGRADRLEAYAVRLASRPGDLVLGVHWRVRLSGDGRTLLAREPLGRGAITLPAADGRAPASVALTHHGACPHELHHYLSLKHGVALDLLALESATRWRVEGGRSRAVR